MIRSWAAGDARRPARRALRRVAGRAVAAAARPNRPAQPGRATDRRMRADPRGPDRPRSCRSASPLFGLTRIPRSYLDVLAAIASGRDVHLFVLHPSPELWRRVNETVSARGRTPLTARRDDRTAELPVNRLLASWGRDVRELQLVLAGAGESVEHHHELPGGEARTPARRDPGRHPRRSPATRTPAARPAGPPAAARRRRSTASRSTPATGARARSRSCATPCSTCSRTTRRSSRAT